MVISLWFDRIFEILDLQSFLKFLAVCFHAFSYTLPIWYEIFKWPYVAGSSGTGTNSANGNTHGHITPTTVCYEYSYMPDSNSNHSKSGQGVGGGPGGVNNQGQGGFLRPLSEHHYEQPMVIMPPSQNSPSDSLDKPAGTTGSRYVNNYWCNLTIFKKLFGHFFLLKSERKILGSVNVNFV